MIELTRDPIWQFIGAMLALVTIGVTIYFFILQRNRKSLSYKIISDTNLLTVNEEIKGKLKIIYEDKLIKNVHLLKLKIMNNGNIPILSSDFEEPLQFNFGQNSEILTAEVTEVFRKNLKPTVFTDKSRIVVEPILLNSKDYFIVKILLTGYKKNISPETRIIGIGEVKYQSRRASNIGILIYNVFLFFTTFFCVMLGLKAGKEDTTVIIAGIFFYTLGIIIALFLFGIDSIYAFIRSLTDVEELE